MPKRSRLASGFFCPVFGRSGYQMVGTGIRSNPNTASGSVLGGLLYRTSPVYKWSILPRTRHLVTGPFKNKFVCFSNTVNIRKLDESGFRIVYLHRVVEWSDNRMAFKNRTNLSGFGTVRHFVNI